MFDAKQFLANLNGKARRRALAGAETAVVQFGEHVLGRAQEDAPVKTGALKNSGTAQQVQRRGSNIEMTIGFNTNYAAAVHERLDAHHDQGRAKYLEANMQAEGPKFGPFVERKMREAL